MEHDKAHNISRHHKNTISFKYIRLKHVECNQKYITQLYLNGSNIECYNLYYT